MLGYGWHFAPENACTLSDYGIAAGATVNLGGRLCGGTKRSARARDGAALPLLPPPPSSLPLLPFVEVFLFKWLVASGTKHDRRVVVALAAKGKISGDVMSIIQGFDMGRDDMNREALLDAANDAHVIWDKVPRFDYIVKVCVSSALSLFCLCSRLCLSLFCFCSNCVVSNLC